MDERIILGIDVGGTFTDVVVIACPEPGPSGTPGLRDGRRARILAHLKLPSTPRDPADAILQGVDRIRLKRPELAVESVLHGTTVGTNTLIEKRGAKSALLTTRGFRDVLVLRRQARPRLYDLNPRVSEPLIERSHRLEVDERVAPDGVIVTALSEAALSEVGERLTELNVDAVAVVFLHAYANPTHERAVAERLRQRFPGVFVTTSSEVSGEFGEYERTSTTVVNAYIGPAVDDYLYSLRTALADREISKVGIVKSNGGLVSVENAKRFPVHLIESGPAAGVIATAEFGRSESVSNLIAFDMGGTTAKAGVVVDGHPRLTTEFHADRFVAGDDLGGYPIKSPVVDLVEIGAGGGSIARVNEAGVLEVGPQSAGAEPGPACYGKGGQLPTVTDAHAVVGHLAAAGFGASARDGSQAGPVALTEAMALQVELARRAVDEHVAQPLGWSVERAAWGIIRIATANMSEMVRLATLRRGLDPRDFSLVAFGGAGGLYASAIAREVGVSRVLIPPLAGLFSAFGTVFGDVRHNLVQTQLRRLSEVKLETIAAGFAQLKARAWTLRRDEDLLPDAADWIFETSLDLRFERQLFELSVPVDDPSGAAAGETRCESIEAWAARQETAFRHAYCAQYGYDLPSHPVELVNLRLVARYPNWNWGWPTLAEESPAAEVKPLVRTVYDECGHPVPTAVYRRENLSVGQRADGPLIIEDTGATISVLAAQRVEVQPSGSLVIEAVSPDATK